MIGNLENLDSSDSNNGSSKRRISINFGGFDGGNSSSGRFGRPVATRFILIEKTPSLSDIVPYALIFFIYGIIIQTILTLWKKAHKKSYDFFILFLVTIFPPVVAFIASSKFFCIIWAFFLLLMISMLYKASEIPMKKETPRQIYRTFKILFTGSYIFISVGQFLTVISFFFFMNWIMFSLKFLFYSVYFAVFMREFIANISHIIAIKTGFFSKEGIPGMMDSHHVCMICNNNLTDQEKILTLGCGHSYHDECIKGWFLIGQNSYCQYCKKGIDKSLIDNNLLGKTELFFRPLMNFIRSFIAFFIIIFCYVSLKSMGN